MSDSPVSADAGTVVLSRDELQSMIANAVAAGRNEVTSGVSAVAAPEIQPEYSIGDVLRLLVNSIPLRDETQVRACHDAIGKTFPEKTNAE